MPLFVTLFLLSFFLFLLLFYLAAVAAVYQWVIYECTNSVFCPFYFISEQNFIVSMCFWSLIGVAVTWESLILFNEKIRCHFKHIFSLVFFVACNCSMFFFVFKFLSLCSSQSLVYLKEGSGVCICCVHFIAL